MQCRQKRLTKQEMGRECNINTIMRRALERGMLPNKNLEPLYGDFSSIGSYQDAKIRVQETKAAFMTLPANVRLRFGNDPGALIKFCEDPENLPEAIELGIVEKPQPVEKEEKKEEKPQPVVEKKVTDPPAA